MYCRVTKNAPFLTEIVMLLFVSMSGIGFHCNLPNPLIVNGIGYCRDSFFIY